MELSPEEYGAYWRASMFVTAGVVIAFLGTSVASMLFSYGNLGAFGIGVFLFVAFVLAGTFVAMLGLARAIRTAVDAEMRG